MKIKINKKLLLEDWMQYMMDHYGEPGAEEYAKVHSQSLDDNIQDEHILDKTEKPDFKPSPDAPVLKGKYNYFDDPEHTSMRMIRKVADKHHINYDKAIDNAHKYMKKLHHQENDYKVHGSNHVKGSTIEGAYQTSKKTLESAAKRFVRGYPELTMDAPYLNINHPLPVKDMNLQQQTAMTIANLSQHGNSTNHLQHFPKMLEGNKQAAHEMYYLDHHTKPDLKTIQRWERIDPVPDHYNHRAEKILMKRALKNNDYNYARYIKNAFASI